MESQEVNAKDIAIVNEDILRGKIHVIRGQKVMLDFDLAEIYGYTTKAFNQQVQRNIERFDDDFRFQLTAPEWGDLRSQFVTSSWGGIRYLPYAFTEQGVYMLMTVLKGDLAIRQSKSLIRLFKQLKDNVIENQGLIGQREFLRLSAQTTDNLRDVMELKVSVSRVEDKVAGVIEELADKVSHSELSEVMLDFGNPAVRRGYFLLNGNPVEANVAYAEIYGQACRSIMIVDNYIGLKTLVLLKAVPRGVPVTVFSDNKGRGLHSSELADFRREYPDIEVELKSAGGVFHDRYVMLDFGSDTEKLYHCGASSKDAGNRATTILEIPERQAYQELFNRLLNNPLLSLP